MYNVSLMQCELTALLVVCYCLIQCYIFLNDAESTAQVLEKLSRGEEEEVLTAYQIAFDLYESATQQFLGRVQECFRGVLPALPSTGECVIDT